jgi:hypothetical protein
MQKTRPQTRPLDETTESSPATIWVSRANGDKSFGAIFEDNGKTANFYLCALDTQEILGYVEVYQTADLPYPMRKEYIEIHWAEHGQRAALCIRGWPVAGFDVPNRKGWFLEEVPQDTSEQAREAALIDALVVE